MPTVAIAELQKSDDNAITTSGKVLLVMTKLYILPLLFKERAGVRLLFWKIRRQEVRRAGCYRLAKPAKNMSLRGSETTVAIAEL